MYLVAYDGSEYAKGALIRAVEFADLTRVNVEAFSVVPDSGRFAAEQDWVVTKEEFELEQFVSELHEQVTTLAPEAGFEYQVIDGHTVAGRIGKEIRSRVLAQSAEVVFIGSENIGGVATSANGVGRHVSPEDEYDLHIVRTSARGMPDIDQDRREALQRERSRPKPSWGPDTM